MTLRFDNRSRVSTYTQSWVSGVNPDFGAFESIATVTVGSTPVSEIVFSSIPQNYKHLQVRGIVRNSVTEGNFRIQFNSDTGSNYSFHQFAADGGGSSTASYASSSQSYITSGNFTGVSSVFTGEIFDILDYTDTNKFKTTRGLSGFERNGAGSFGFNSGNWRSTSAITSIRFFAGNDAFAQYSSLALYGIQG
jgi:hypothetical protein